LKGWQRAIRRRARPIPRRAPCSCTASTAYAEQVGSNRHRRGSAGEIRRWYMSITKTVSRAALPISQRPIRPAKSHSQVLFQLVEAGPGRVRVRPHHHIQLTPSIHAVERRSQPSPHPVPGDRAPHRSRDGDADPAPRAPRRTLRHEHRQPIPARPCPSLTHTSEILASLQRSHGGSPYDGAGASHSGRQPRAPLGPAVLQNRTTSPRPHPSSESMLSLATTRVGLKGTFGHENPVRSAWPRSLASSKSTSRNPGAPGDARGV
jgi:hypothetical protein